jgi:hypothetical protein
MNVRLSIVSCPLRVPAGCDFTVRVAVANRGAETLHSDGGTPLHLSYRWRGAADDREPLRTVFWQTVAPGEVKLFDIRIDAPPAPVGPLVVTLVRENVRWFDSGDGAVCATCDVLIVPSEQPVPLDLRCYERRLRSQNGEDGIIAELLLRVGWQHRFIVEFGVSDGFESNSATLIQEYGWGAFLIESDASAFGRLTSRFGGRPNVTMVNATVSSTNIAELFAAAHVPLDPDVLSIDIDGNDYWIWSALSEYRPRIVVIEYNPAYAPPCRWVMQYDAAHRWRGDTHYGASLASLTSLGTKLGYALIGTDSRGINAFFVRSDLAGAARMVPREAEAVYTPAAAAHPFGPGPFVEV